MNREVVINGRFLSRRITGVERYSGEILSLIEGKCRMEKTRMNGFAGHMWEQFILPSKLRPSSILWSPANTGPLFVRNQILTIHDLSPLEHPEWFSKSFAAWYHLFLPILARRVRRIFTPSEHVKQKVLKRFPSSRVTVTPNGVDTNRFHPGAKQSKFEFPKKYIFFIGSLQPRKNLESLLRSWQSLKCQHPDTWLLIAGEAGTIFGSVKFIADERVRWVGYVPDENLPGLYAGALLFVLPSLDEGFGLPALEAMACGTPVVIANAGALPEVIGDAGIIFNPFYTESLTDALRNGLEDTTLRARLTEKGLRRARGFSWQSTANIVLDALHEA